ncbi:MAG: SurA N-terminal domain-containing protein [Pelagimonas sp.]|nr:SurA N-terminal domain-containing protein [Pelagimonas sp.]
MAQKRGTTSKMFVWGLLGLLILGLGGFGATNFSGAQSSIGSVGQAEIGINDYARALQNEIRAIEAQTGQPLGFQQAQAMGLPDRVLARLVVTAALEDEANSLGISMGDTRLAEELRNVAAFQGVDGEFNRETYRMVLENANLSEREFEEDLRAEGAATLLQGAVLAGTTLPDSYVNTLLTYTGERRSLRWAELGSDRLSIGLPVPSEDDQKAWYEENIANYTRPETKQITYAWLTPDMIVDTVEVEEDLLRASYEERNAEFNMPERRLVERLVFADVATAEAAMARVSAGTATFEDLVAERDLDLADTDLGDVTRGDLGDAAEMVFAAALGDVAGPAPSDLGPALFRVNAVLAAQETSYEEAVPALRAELALDRARRVIEAQAQGFDDDMAGGATLEELAQTTDLQLGQIGWTGAEDSGIAGFENFRDLAAQVTTDDYPAIADLGDGGVFAIRLDEISAPAPIPFEDVQSDIVASMDHAATTQALVKEAETLIAGDLETAGLTFHTEAALTRTSFGANLPAGMLDTLFTLEPGKAAALAGNGVAYVVVLDEIQPVDLQDDGTKQLTRLFADQAEADVANDLFSALSADIQTRAGVEIDRAVINAVHANFQ